MAANMAHQREEEGTSTIVRHLHGLVTYGPWDLDVASAMSAHGYDEVKWAEGQVMLAELVNCGTPAGRVLDAATAWYDEAATTARQALAAQPQLLAKLGITVESTGCQCRVMGAI